MKTAGRLFITAGICVIVAWAINTQFPEEIPSITQGGALLLGGGMLAAVLWATWRFTAWKYLLPLFCLVAVGWAALQILPADGVLITAAVCSGMLAVFGMFYATYVFLSLFNRSGGSSGGGGGGGRQPDPNTPERSPWRYAQNKTLKRTWIKRPPEDPIEFAEWAEQHNFDQDFIEEEVEND